MRINADRLHENLRQLAQIGATPGGGVTRLALSHEDRAARDLLRRWMEEAGLRVRIDDFGNMTGRRAGAESGAAVMLGLPSRYCPPRWPLRRRLWGARGAGGDPHAQRSGGDDAPPARDRQLDQ